MLVKQFGKKTNNLILFIFFLNVYFSHLIVLSFSPVKSPATEFRFKFTEPTVRDNAAQIKERLLAWCRSKTKEYEVNITHLMLILSKISIESIYRYFL